ncbi:hypothetical protein RISK_000317 [Rhodopirellula islandica]|uniref:Cytochrome c-552/4 domain-containing protein n=2 Tax=Rhodopirellula islandica TaxID=595434 RepID=A0A0J1BMD3_RHOIS|nr:hypothetical protein RISK_000317 [Rhodopirellula islandica]
MIGSDACIECHPKQAEAFSQTTHAKSARRIQREELPLGSDFVDGKSGRLYEAEMTDEGMRHRESVLGTDGELIAQDSVDLVLELGSGTHAHTYLGKRDGYWIESPLTWYQQTSQWGLSPGFDGEDSAMFDRVVTTTCVFCHVGEVRADKVQPSQFSITHASIACERCHGSGVQHVADQKSDENLSPSEMNIVHPGKIARENRDAICSQCHLQGIVSSSSSDFDRWDFHPGELLSEHVTEFQLDEGEESFRIVGHTEQLHQSECYLQTEVLSCVTCHHPHPVSGEAVAYRDLCIGCHASPASCDVPLSVRIETQQDQCQACHMPKRPTNVTHAALHDHRIAVHDESFLLAELSVPKSASAPASEKPRLVAISATDHLEETERERRRLLAFHSLASSGGLPGSMKDDFKVAQRELVELFKSGVNDASVRTTLANSYFAAGKWSTAENLARSVVESESVGSHTYVGAVDVLARVALRLQDNEAAKSWYRELTQMRRVSGDHFMLGVCELNANRIEPAILAFEQALRIDSTLLVAHEYLAQIFQAENRMDRSRLHQQAARRLRAISLDQQP